MKLFKNGVGRPSNETLKKRKIVYISLSLVLVIMLMMTSFMLNSAFKTQKISGKTDISSFGEKISTIVKKIFFKSGKGSETSTDTLSEKPLSYATTTTKMPTTTRKATTTVTTVSNKKDNVKTPSFDITGIDTNLSIEGKVYNKGTGVVSTDIGTKIVLVEKDKTIKVRAVFPVNMGGIIPYIRIIAYKADGSVAKDENGNLYQTAVEKMVFKDNKPFIKEYQFKVSKDIKFIQSEIYMSDPTSKGTEKICINAMTSSDCENVTFYMNRINLSVYDITDNVSVTLNSSLEVKKSEENIVKVPEYGEYISRASIKNNTNQTLYLRWFAYDGIQTEKTKAASSSKCWTSSSKSFNINNLKVKVKEKQGTVSGKLKVYDSKVSCEADSDSKNTTEIKSDVIHYTFDSKSTTSVPRTGIIADEKTVIAGYSYRGQETSMNVVQDNYIYTDENNNIKIKEKIPKSIYNSKKYNIKFSVYGKNNSVIKEQEYLVDKNIIDYDVKVDENAKYVIIEIYENNTKFSNIIHRRKINVACKMQVTLTDSTGKNDGTVIYNDKGQGKLGKNYEVTQEGNYLMDAVIKNPSEAPYYYRWYTFNDLDANNKKLSYKTIQGEYCKQFTAKEKSILKLGLRMDKTSKRSGKIKIYTSANQCKTDQNSQTWNNIGYSIINYRYVNLSDTISIVLKDKSGLKSNKNIVNVTNTGDYHVEATVTQTGNSKLYYRWDTYTGVNANNHSYTDDRNHGDYTYCSSFTDKSKTFASLETLEFTKEDTPRSGKFSLYSSESDCKDGKNSVKSAVIGYQIPKKTTTTKKTTSNSSKISISFKDTDGSEKDSSGAYVVSSSGAYTPIVTIKNPNAQEIYYRWFTYRGLNASTFNWASSCESTSKKEYTKKDLENLWVDTSGEYSQRSGKLKVYSDYNSCDKDGTGTNSSNVLALSIVNYKYNDPSTNTTGFKFLRNYTNGNATLANITKKIGSQTPSDCYDYALAYGVYIIKNGSGSFDNLKCNSYYHPAGDYGGSAYGANGSGQYTNSVTGYRNMYDKIKSTIDSSLPIVIRIDNSRAGGSGTHFITIIGYKDIVKSTSINSWSDFKRALWVLDPAYPEGGQVMSKPLSSFAYDFYDNPKEPSRLFWWNKASDAKMPKWCDGQY